LFAQKRLDFHLHFSPNDRTANTVYEERQWEASFSLDLARLNWFSKALSSGREKVDVLVPVLTQTLGAVIAKISGLPLSRPRSVVICSASEHRQLGPADPQRVHLSQGEGSSLCSPSPCPLCRDL
jgi:hypothetical protein